MDKYRISMILIDYKLDKITIDDAYEKILKEASSKTPSVRKNEDKREICRQLHIICGYRDKGTVPYCNDPLCCSE